MFAKEKKRSRLTSSVKTLTHLAANPQANCWTATALASSSTDSSASTNGLLKVLDLGFNSSNAGGRHPFFKECSCIPCKKRCLKVLELLQWPVHAARVPGVCIGGGGSGILSTMWWMVRVGWWAMARSRMEQRDTASVVQCGLVSAGSVRDCTGRACHCCH